MASLKELEEQIFQREGFRVEFQRLGAPRDLPDYGFEVMAPTTWRVSDWKMARLGAYVALLRGVTVFRGDGEVQKTDVRLGHLRDTYYAARYGSTKPPEPEALSPNVIPIERAASRRPKAGEAKKTPPRTSKRRKS